MHLLTLASAVCTLHIITSAVCMIPYMLISHTHQPCTFCPPFTSTKCNLILLGRTVSKFFSLAISEGICDLRLPSASRIPDISYYGVDLMLYSWSRFFFACDFQSYSCYWLVPLYPTFNSFAHCLSITLHHPQSPSDCLSFFILVFFLYSTPGQAQIRSLGMCRGCRPAKIVYWSPVTSWFLS